MTPGNIQDELARVVDSAKTVDMRRFEEASPAMARSALLPSVMSLMEGAVSVLGNVLAHYETQAEEADRAEASVGEEDTGQFYQGIEALLLSEEGVRRITDLAFMARWELSRKFDALKAAQTSNELWSIISECGSARRKLMKSLIAVEIAVTRHEGRPSELEIQNMSERKRSIETRRVYARLRRELRKLPPFSEATSRANLRAGGTAIAVIIGHSIYEDLRVSDRIELREVQRRILGWLRGEGDTSWQAGRRLFEDLEACTNLFLQVNHRGELREHDADVLQETLLELRTTGTRELPEPSRLRLRSLFGRDERLDELIETRAESKSDWQQELERVLSALTGESRGTSFEPAGASESNESSLTPLFR